MKAPPVPLESLANRSVTPAPKPVWAINEAARTEPTKRRTFRLVKVVFKSIAGGLSRWGKLAKL
jgi:hypothetical protein